MITSGVIGLIGVLVVVLVAAAIYPTMLNQTQSLETNADLGSANQSLVAVFDTLAVVAYVLLPLALIFLVIRIAQERRRGG